MGPDITRPEEVIDLLSTEAGRQDFERRLAPHLTRLELSAKISPVFSRWEGREALEFGLLIEGMCRYIDGPAKERVSGLIRRHRELEAGTPRIIHLDFAKKSEGDVFTDIMRSTFDRLKISGRSGMIASWDEKGSKALFEFVRDISKRIMVKLPEHERTLTEMIRKLESEK